MVALISAQTRLNFFCTGCKRLDRDLVFYSENEGGSLESGL